MNDLCKFYTAHLPLYLEGELRDASVRERVQTHLLGCEECRVKAEEYGELTQEIAGLLDPVEGAVCASGGSRSGLRTAGAGADASLLSRRASRERVDAILDAVARQGRPAAWMAPRPAPRLRPLPSARRRFALAAAAALLLGGAAIVLTLARPGADLPGMHQDQSVAVLEGAPAFQAGELPVAAAAGMSDEDAVEDRELVRWVLASRDERADPQPGDEVRLVRVVSRVRPQNGQWMEVPESPAAAAAPRWVLHARLKEAFRDPLGGGWTFLLPSDGVEETRDSSRGEAIPFRRILLQKMALENQSGAAASPPLQAADRYQIYIVPDVAAQRQAPPLLLNFQPAREILLHPTDPFQQIH